MGMLTMFLKSPPSGVEVNSVYRKKHSWGPHEQGFSNGVTIEIIESAPEEYRSVYSIMKGWIQVVGVQEGSQDENPSPPLILRLTPSFEEFVEVEILCKSNSMITPTVYLFNGIDLMSMRENLLHIIDMSPPSSFGEEIEEKWNNFITGKFPIFVGLGQPLGKVSEIIPNEGYYSFEFSILSNSFPKNNLKDKSNVFLDPVSFFTMIVKSVVEGKSISMPKDDIENSWMKLFDKDQLIISIKNEWFEPVSNSFVSIQSDKETTELLPLQNGTIILDSTYKNFKLYLNNAPLLNNPLLTLVPSHNGGEESLEFNDVSHPNHVFIGATNPQEWFMPTTPIPTGENFNLSLFTLGNSVDKLVDGFEYFPKLVEDIRKINSPSHYILFAGWRAIFNFELIPGDGDSTFEALLSNINNAGAATRALIWDQPSFLNTPAVDYINGLSHGIAILDNKTLNFGSHHWKLIIVSNSDGKFCYLGGIDINSNRLDGPNHGENDSRYHDLHCRIMGPAVDDAIKAFMNRWNDHPDTTNANRMDEHDYLTGSSLIAGNCLIQIARTYGAGTQNYALNGDRTIWENLSNAVLKAKKYIYIEDQYLVYRELSNLLHDNVLSRIDYLIIVIDGTCDLGDLTDCNGQCDKYRYEIFLRQLIEDFPNKVHVFTLNNHGSEYKVHTKAVIIDDIFATIGSANMCQRSMTHDSEINAFILDTQIERDSRKFAKDLRVRLWAEHLGWYNELPLAKIKLSNIDEAVSYLIDRPTTSRLNPYIADTDFGNGCISWFSLIDPNGSHSS